MHFIEKLLQVCILEVLYCQTNDQVVYIFTKTLTKAKFLKLQAMLGVQEIVIKEDRI
jgi:hypothetical protein